MARLLSPVRRPYAVLAGLFALFVLAGCPSDPYDPQTWIEKLDNEHEWKEAVRELDKLKDPSAIEALGKAWERYNRDSTILGVVINLAELPEDKGGPAWEKAIPILQKAVEDYDASKSASVSDATVAADALGRSHDPSVVDTLVRAAKTKPRLAAGENVRVAAIRALGKFGDNDRAVSTLIKILEAEPKLGPDKKGSTKKKQPIQLNAAAANALAETRNPKALQPLIVTMYRISIIFPQIRNAVTRLGDPAIDALIQVMEGKYEPVNKFVKESNAKYDCAKQNNLAPNCIGDGNLDFKAAILLGDMRAKKAVPALLKELGQDAEVSFISSQGLPGPADHNAILDALRKIGDPSAAAGVRDYMSKKETDDVIRPLAIDVYSFLGRDDAGVAYLKKQIVDDSQEDEDIRRAAALAFARVISSEKDLEVINARVKKYQGEVKTQRDKAAKASSEEKKAEATENAALYLNTVQLFEQHKVRGLAALACKQQKKPVVCFGKLLEAKSPEVLALLRLYDKYGNKAFSVFLCDKPPGCYAKGLKVKEKEVAAVLEVDDKGPNKLERGDREAYRIAALERALLELMKLGPKAKDQTDKLLKHADSTERLVRQGVLMALARVAPKDCSKCVERLASVIEAQKNRDTLSELVSETRVVLYYFDNPEGGKKKK